MVLVVLLNHIESSLAGHIKPVMKVIKDHIIGNVNKIHCL
jgi:hypothetical protein